MRPLRSSYSRRPAPSTTRASQCCSTATRTPCRRGPIPTPFSNTAARSSTSSACTPRSRKRSRICRESHPRNGDRSTFTYLPKSLSACRGKRCATPKAHSWRSIGAGRSRAWPTRKSIKGCRRANSRRRSSSLRWCRRSIARPHRSGSVCVMRRRRRATKDSRSVSSSWLAKKICSRRSVRTSRRSISTG